MPNSLNRVDKTSSNEYMGLMYRCANTYVAPYQAEGFNLPVLESLASGTPVIVPHGGSTDDFTRTKFTRYINSTISETIDPQTYLILNRLLRVDEMSLFDEMKFVLDDYNNGMKWLQEASKAAVKYTLKRYQWKHILKMLLNHLDFEKKFCLSTGRQVDEF